MRKRRVSGVAGLSARFADVGRLVLQAPIRFPFSQTIFRTVKRRFLAAVVRIQCSSTKKKYLALGVKCQTNADIAKVVAHPIYEFMKTRITIRVADATAAKLEQVAKARELTVAQLVREFLRVALWPAKEGAR
jgi:malonyl CoA-acyl carrier protein transacylase